jgi:hypothetical protein
MLGPVRTVVSVMAPYAADWKVLGGLLGRVRSGLGAGVDDQAISVSAIIRGTGSIRPELNAKPPAAGRTTMRCAFWAYLGVRIRKSCGWEQAG